MALTVGALGFETPTAVAQEPETLCDGESRPAVFNNEGQLHAQSTRTLYIDLDEMILWQGLSEGGVMALDFGEDTLELCGFPELPGIPVNAILKWRGEIYAATDGYGIWRLSNQEWTHLLPMESMDEAWNDVYNLFIDPRESGDLLVLTRAGITAYDGEDWREFDIMPPDGTRTFHSMSAKETDVEGEYEWLLGSNSHGSYRFVENTWERYSSIGMHRWDEVHQWYMEFDFRFPFPDNVREVELLNDGSWAIAGDESEQSGIAFLHAGTINNPESYYAELPQWQGYSLYHLTSVDARSNENYVVTNWKPSDEGGGTFYMLGDELIPLNNLPSLYVLAMADYVYVATAQGVFRYPVPSEPSNAAG